MDMVSNIEDSRQKMVEKFLKFVEQAMRRVPVRILKMQVDEFSEESFLSSILTPTDAKSCLEDLTVRRELAIARMKIKAFERISGRCSLLDAKTASEILGVTKQALSQRGKAGTVLAYSHGGRKYYPDFQFKNNQILQELAGILKFLEVNPDDSVEVNLVIQDLVTYVDYSNPGEPENIIFRYELIDKKNGMALIRRDFKNHGEMGQ
jgi:hypothetical protein